MLCKEQKDEGSSSTSVSDCEEGKSIHASPQTLKVVMLEESITINEDASTSVIVPVISAVDSKRNCGGIPRIWWIVLVLFFVATGLVVPLVISWSKENAETSTEPMSTAERFEAFAEVVEDVSPDVRDESSHQHAAVLWLAQDDPAQLPIDYDRELLIERYIIMLFYLSCVVDNWWGETGKLGTYHEANSVRFTDWLTDESVCEWGGIDCADNGLITEIRRFSSLGGSIPSELGLLTHLTSLDLISNSALEGPIPSEFGMLTSLTQLWLIDNNLSGTIPSDLGKLKLLETLYLEHNSLTGTIPEELQAIPDLVVRIEGNDINEPESP